MGGRGLDHLIEQNETDLGFLSAYGGGTAAALGVRSAQDCNLTFCMASKLHVGWRPCALLQAQTVKNGERAKIDSESQAPWEN